MSTLRSQTHPAGRTVTATGRIGCVSFLNAKPLIEGLEVAGGTGGAGGQIDLNVPSKLLADLEAGRVMVDGVDLAQIDPAWLRRQIGVVLQENFLFNRSVRDNIALADPGIDMARVMDVARLAGAHEFIVELHDVAFFAANGNRRRQIFENAALVGAIKYSQRNDRHCKGNISEFRRENNPKS